MKTLIQKIKLFFYWLINGKLPAAPAKVIELPNYTVTAFDIEIVRLINEYRINSDLNALPINDMLCNVAASHSQYMADKNEASHDYATDRQNVFPNKIVAEIVGSGYQQPKSFFAGWQKSPSHNKKMLGKNHKTIGIAIYTSTTGVKYATVLFLNDY